MPGSRPPTPAEAISPGGLLDLPNAFEGPSWGRWRVVLKAAWGERLTDEERVLFREVAERDPPAGPVRELWAMVGRGGGKDSIASAIAITAALGSYASRRPGEKSLVVCLAVDRAQAEIVFGYILSYFQTVPALNALVQYDPRSRRLVDEQLSADLGRRMYVVSSSDNSLDLTNGTRIVVATNNFRSIRGRSVKCVIMDEVAFYRSEESANPDKELYDALEPSLARVPSSILVGISSAYRRSGLLYDKFRRCYGKDDPEVLFVRGPTRMFNPGFPQAIIDRRMEEDPAAGASEYGAEFRSDIDAFVTREAISGVVIPGRRELLPVASVNYVGFCDPSGGSGDSMTLGIAHKLPDRQGGMTLLDCVREVRPPFSPEAVTREFAAVLKSYRITQVIGDRYAGEWVVAQFKSNGIRYEHSELAKSDIYRDVLPLINSGQVELLDIPKLEAQFIGLERRTARSGKDSIDHAPDGHDDLVNAACGALLRAGSYRPMKINPESLRRLGITVDYGDGLTDLERRNSFGRMQVFR